MIEVYAFSQLKKIREKACTQHDFTTYVFDTHNICHTEWIKPCQPGQHYRAMVGYQFIVGSNHQFEVWKSQLCKIVHGCELREYLEICAPNNYFYALLTCSPAETFLGSTICRSLYEDFVKFWPKLVNLHRTDIQLTEYFITRYLHWQHLTWVASQKGCLEFG